MSKKYPGGIIRGTPVTPSGPFESSTAPGIWTIDQATNFIRQGIWPTAGNIAPDPFFENVTMLLHGDGTNGGQNNTFLDSSTNNFTITRAGNTTQGSFSPYGPNWSNYFDGAGDYLSVPDNTALEGFTDFTFECWLYASDFAQGDIVFAKGFAPGFAPYMFYFTDTDLEFYASSSLSSWDVAEARKIVTNIVKNQWYHVAASRSGSTIRLFANGVLATSFTSGLTLGNNSGTFNVASAVDGTRNPEIYVSNLRINNTALYTAAFTPSTTPLTAVAGTQLLTCQSNRFRDNSTNAFTVSSFGTASVQRFSPFSPPSPGYSTATIGGSGYFDGTGDFLTANCGRITSDFTVEGWAFFSPAATKALCTVSTLSSPSYGLVIYTDGTDWRLYLGATNWNINNQSMGSFSPNAWNHIAVTRSGSTVRGFVNGVLGFTGTFSGPVGDNSSATQTLIGEYSTWVPTGYISDFRIIFGSAQYTANFTPPTAPVTAITNTRLLLNFTNGAIFDNAMMNDLETVGNAQISTSVVKYGTGSLAFDGTGDWLTGNFPSRDLYSFGTGDFTVEMWVYTSNLSNFQTLLDTRAADSQTSWCLFLDNAGKPYWYDASGVQLSSTAISSNTWTHLAVSRSGSTLRMFLSGTQVFSGTNTNSQNPTGPFYVARNTVNAFLYTGYIDDLRITKGVARYTANFTPPTAAFQNF